MTEIGTPNGRTASSPRLARFPPLRIVMGLWEERRRFIEEKKRLLSDLRSAVDDATRATNELRAAADEAVKKIESAMDRLSSKVSEPNEAELLSTELLKHWKQQTNWRHSALRSLEELAKKGSGGLAQWAAKELFRESNIKLSDKKYYTRARLTQLARDGTVFIWPEDNTNTAKTKASKRTPANDQAVGATQPETTDRLTD